MKALEKRPNYRHILSQKLGKWEFKLIKTFTQDKCLYIVIKMNKVQEKYMLNV